MHNNILPYSSVHRLIRILAEHVGRGQQKNVKNSKYHQAGGARKGSGRRPNALHLPCQNNKLNFTVTKKSGETMIIALTSTILVMNLEALTL